MDRPVTYRVAVVGGGTMGVGIAYVAALAGGSVIVVEPDASRAAAIGSTVRGAVESAIERGKLDAVRGAQLKERIERVAAIDEIPDGFDVAIETVPERLELKLSVLTQIERRRPGLLATNTSALPISRLAQALCEPSQFLGMHFFNPVWSLRLVELIIGSRTSTETLDSARCFAAWLGKESLTVRDVPGFATSRLDLIASLEAMRMLESGVASADDIDRAAVLAYRHPVGPLRLSDIVGLDVRLDVARTLEAAHGARFSPPTILIEMVQQGRLGVKTGRGFFDWPT